MKSEWLVRNLEGISFDLPEANHNIAVQNIEHIVFPNMMNFIINTEPNPKRKGVLIAMKGMIVKEEVPLYFPSEDDSVEGDLGEMIQMEEIDLKEDKKGIRIQVSKAAVRLLPAPDDREFAIGAIKTAMLSAFDSFVYLKSQGIFKPGPY